MKPNIIIIGSTVHTVSATLAKQEEIVVVAKPLNEIIEEDNAYPITNPHQHPIFDRGFIAFDFPERSVVPPKIYKRRR